MRKKRIASILLVILLMFFLSFSYFKNGDNKKNLVAIDYSNDKDYWIILDTNGGELVCLDHTLDEIRDGVYGAKDGQLAKFVDGPFFTNLNGKLLKYWSKDHKCSTKDIDANTSQFDDYSGVYYACYEDVNFDNNGKRFVRNDGYVSGDIVACGDEIRVTKCYSNYQGAISAYSFTTGYKEKIVEYCEFDQINGESASGKVYRNSLSDARDFECEKQYTAYFHEDSSKSNETIDGYGLECGNTSYYDNGVCSATANKDKQVSTPNSSGLNYNGRKFIGWAADNDGVNVNCSGNLVTDKKVILNNDVHYYACYEQEEKCENTKSINNGKGSYDVKVCYNVTNKYGELIVDPVSDDYDEILSCANGYTLDKVSRTNVIENTCKDAGKCYKTYELNCVGGKPKISATTAMVDGSGYGTIKFSASSSVGIKGYYVSSYYEKPTKNSDWVLDSSGNYSESLTPGTVFLWTIDNEDQISYAAMTSVIDRVNTDTTVKNLDVKTMDGTNLNPEVYAFSDVDDGITSSDYVRLSNKINDDSKVLANGFNPFDTAYKVTTSSNKIAVYATLTSDDASFVNGYEPRTVDLNYGVNTILIKIQNKKGNIRTYTIIATREDDRDATNLLKILNVSEGKINFDPYKSDYVVSVGKNKDSVSINGELSSLNASYVDGFGPRKVSLKNESTTVAIKVKSETGSVRAYTITFVKSGEETSDSKEALLSSLSLSKAYIAFDKNVYEYNTTVDFEIDSINIYALALNGGDSITLYKKINGETKTISNENIKLDVGTNTITIIVANKDGKTKTYTINILRKENGLDISSDTKLSMLDVDGYNIEFDPDKYYYEVKIKREKTLVIAATPVSNRAEIYISGNDNLTAFSTVKIKVVSEDGQFKEYKLDIKKDAFNQKIEIIGLISGFIIIVCGIIIIRVKRRRKSINDYYAE